MKQIYKPNTFLCFSPPVMIATFIIEIGLALRILHRYRASAAVHITIAILFALATFQLAEYGVCEHVGLGGDRWAQLGFSAITLLPPLGFHLTYAIAGKRPSYVVWGAYVLAAGWIAVFLFGGVMKDQICHGNYVIFEMKRPFELLYYSYYNTLLVAAVAKAWFLSGQTKGRQKTALYFLIAGYASFIVPSIVTRFMFEFDEGTSSALPSVMYGFAVLLALTISLKVIPTISKRK